MRVIPVVDLFYIHLPEPDGWVVIIYVVPLIILRLLIRWLICWLLVVVGPRYHVDLRSVDCRFTVTLQPRLVTRYRCVARYYR